MKKNSFKKNYFFFACKFIFLLIIINIPFHKIEIIILSQKITIKNEYNFTNLNSIYSLFQYNISYNTVLIFEAFEYHYECTPGFAKYFIDLGYKIDIIMSNYGISSFFRFEEIDKIRFFIYNEIDDIKKYKPFFKSILINYNYVIIETANPIYFFLYKSLNLLNIYHSFFVFHHLDYVFDFPRKFKLRKNQIWSLGNFNSSIQVNPHYFGNFKNNNKSKNKITRFFITSTTRRNYQPLISAVEKLKEENLEFHVIVVGKYNTFTINNISEKLLENFTFKYNIPYEDLYYEVNNSDYIIINLDPNSIIDEPFRKTRVSGSIQLSYGFLKPVIINKYFADIFNFNSNNSFIYDNINFTATIRNAINIGNKAYINMVKNLNLVSKKVYKDSLYNIKKCLNEL